MQEFQKAIASSSSRSIVANLYSSPQTRLILEYRSVQIKLTEMLDVDPETVRHKLSAAQIWLAWLCGGGGGGISGSSETFTVTQLASSSLGNRHLERPVFGEWLRFVQDGGGCQGASVSGSQLVAACAKHVVILGRQRACVKRVRNEIIRACVTVVSGDGHVCVHCPNCWHCDL